MSWREGEKCRFQSLKQKQYYPKGSGKHTHKGEQGEIKWEGSKIQEQTMTFNTHTARDAVS